MFPSWPPRSWSPRAARRSRGGGPRLTGRWPGGPSPASGSGAAGSSPGWRPPGRSRWPWASGWPCTVARAGRRCRCAARSPARRGRGRAQRRDRVRRQPHPPARLARPVRGDLGRCRENNSGTGTGPVVATVKRDRQVAAWATGWAGAPLHAGHTGFQAIVLPVPGGMSFVLPPATGRLPRSSREIALGTKTLWQLHAPVGTPARSPTTAGAVAGRFAWAMRQTVSDIR